MTIDEAVEKFKFIANSDSPCPRYCMFPCDKCVDESKQLAEWLEELKVYQQHDKLNKLIQKDDYGNFGIKGLSWESLYTGRIITEEVYEKIYGCIFKLMEYEDSGLNPDQVANLVDKLNSSGR